MALRQCSTLLFIKILCGSQGLRFLGTSFLCGNITIKDYHFHKGNSKDKVCWIRSTDNKRPYWDKFNLKNTAANTKTENKIISIGVWVLFLIKTIL